VDDHDRFIPVIPPELRPLVPLDGAGFANLDLNGPVRTVVINRTTDSMRLIELPAPTLTSSPETNEKRMLQESVDALFDTAVVAAVSRVCQQAWTVEIAVPILLKGKQGSLPFKNLLRQARRLSGFVGIIGRTRAESCTQCGLPKKMALELFKPFILLPRLEAKSVCLPPWKAAKKAWWKKKRVPKSGIFLTSDPRTPRHAETCALRCTVWAFRAFEPVSVEGKAIQLHPLGTCSAFNADFGRRPNGCSRSHCRLKPSLKARVLIDVHEQRFCRLQTVHRSVVPSTGYGLGLYYTTLECEGHAGERHRCLVPLEEVEHALDCRAVHLHTAIKARSQSRSMRRHEVMTAFDHHTRPYSFLVRCCR